MLFGNHLRKVRNSKNISLRELSFAMDSDKSTLSALENGHVIPTIFFISRVCKGLDVTVSEFFEDFD